MSTHTSDPGSEIEAALSGFFRDTWPDDMSDDPDVFRDDQWSAVTELGLTTIGLPEHLGGAGGSLSDLVAVLQLAGRHAVPLPIAEANLAAWLTSRSGHTAGSGPMWSTIARPERRDHLTIRDGLATGELCDVPWGNEAPQVLALGSAHGAGAAAGTIVVDPDRCTVTVREDLAGQPIAHLTLDDTPVTRWDTDLTADEFALRGMLVTAALMSGAMTGAADLTREYVEVREQFGRPISKFQAVQHHVVELVQMAVMTRSMVERVALVADPTAQQIDIRALKLTSNENAAHVTRAAHQAHGAIGMTREYRLHRLTRRLHLWRDAFGTDLELAGQFGELAATAPSLAALLLDDTPGPAGETV
ncbi:acyl-CoA dehydrogenase [Ilumatobacter fluminis]|uniref:Acyl-CoA dehydrogenase n=1 Tax=Ilumatobacter fluminis TaxID=467091 RepID=A0A4R7HXF6_9ACTN|nr:acyl-CoA dehydrogenase family protein [Ilumatobacter fluminis]TDT15867.1 acyl-CoA dehydrogenase [Ilumatobacter fluminis]